MAPRKVRPIAPLSAYSRIEREPTTDERFAALAAEVTAADSAPLRETIAVALGRAIPQVRGCDVTLVRATSGRRVQVVLAIQTDAGAATGCADRVADLFGAAPHTRGR